jgi:peroxiredoxin
MSATVNCPECRAPLELPDTVPAGKRLQCPDCGAAFSPPGEADLDRGLMSEPTRTAPRGPAGNGSSGPRPRPRRNPEDFERDEEPRRRGSGSSVVVIAAVVVILLLALGVSAAVLLAYRGQVEEREAAVAAQNVQANNNNGGQGPNNMGGGMAGGPGMMGGGPGGPPVVGGGPGGVAPVPVLQKGSEAPEIEGEDLDGKPMKLSEFRGKVVVLDFWGDWCPHCKPAYTYQNHLVARLKGEPFVLLGVNCDATKGQAKEVVKAQKLTWRSWYDGDSTMTGPIYTKYGVKGIPTTFIIDKKGIIQQRIDGATNEWVLDPAVDQVLAQDEKRPPGSPPVWRAGSTAFSQLGEEVAVGGYVVRPPTGFTLEKLTPAPGQETYRWKGQKRPDGTEPVFEVALGPAPPADKKLEDLLEKELEGIASRRLGWSCSAAERGEIRGLIFTRALWNLMESQGKWKGTGYVYAAVDGDRLVRITFRDTMPTFGFPQAAPLTFHKAPPK